MATPASSAAAMTSSSRIEPPGWITAVALGVLVRDAVIYLYVCTLALFVLFAGPGWIMTRAARAGTDWLRAVTDVVTPHGS